MDQAKKYYAQALEVSLDNVHALAGLKWCLTHMKKDKTLSAEDDALLALVEDRWKVAYSPKSKDVLEQSVVRMIEQFS